MSQTQKITITTTTDFADVVMDAIGRAMIAVVLAGFQLIWWAVLFPMVSVPAGLSVAAGWWFGWPFGIGVAGVAVAGMVLWRVSSPQTFERWLTGRIRSRWLTWARYSRRWATVMAACQLTKTDINDRTITPRLVDVQIGESLDVVKAKMLPGHSPGDWENRVEHLAHAFGTRHAQASIVGPSLVEITFRRSDSLAEPIVVDFESMAGFKTLPSRKAA
jgi:S-DNA-T family DNA segregation ATPase FtsK/SpoIIIE